MLIRILIVDDEQPMVELLTRFLTPMASYIDSADDLPEAIEKARTGKFNIVLLDLKLKTTGKEAALQAIHEFKHYLAAVVVVSGLPEQNLKEEVMGAGASAFVSKDGGFGERALLLATHIATLKLPKDSYKSDSFLSHVEMLNQMVHAA